MTKQMERIKRMNELWTRLFEVAKTDPRASLSLNEWNQIMAKFKLDTGLSENTVGDYIKTFRGMGAISDNWTYLIQELSATTSIAELERRVRYFVNLTFKMPKEIKG